MLPRWDGIGQVMSSVWFPPDMMLRIEAKQFSLGFIRPVESLELSQRDQGPSSPIAQFGRAAVLVIPNFFHLGIMEATVLLGTFKQQN